MQQKDTDTRLTKRNQIDKLTIIGAGFSGLMIALLAHLEYRLRGEVLRIMIGDEDPINSPASNLAASITHNEILAVVPSPAEARAFLEKEYSQLGGLAASLVHLKTPGARAFIDQVYLLADNPEQLKKDQIALENYGTYCMLLWEKLFGIVQKLGDEKLLKVLLSNSDIVLPARPGEEDNGKNYRLDIYFNTPTAVSKTQPLETHLKNTGYSDTKVLSPQEYLKYVPYGKIFVEQNTQLNQNGQLVWLDSVSVLRRPAGRINASQFLNHIPNYLQQACGFYVTNGGIQKPLFRLKIRKAVSLDRSPSIGLTKVVDVKMVDPKSGKEIITHRNDSSYRASFYAVNTGSCVQGADQLDILAPKTALFAGTYIQLRVPKIQLSPEEQNIHINFALRTGNNVGGVHTSVVQFYPDPMDQQTLILRIAGTKTFCGDTYPERSGNLQPFAWNRLVIQLNMLRLTFSNLLRPILGDLVTQPFTEHTLNWLVESGFAKIGVESRSVPANNSTYAGPVFFKNGNRAVNAGLCHGPSSAGIANSIGNAKATLSAANFKLSRLFEEVKELELPCSKL